MIEIPKPKSYSIRSQLSYRVREFDPNDHIIVNETPTHNQYDCPFCIDVRGEPDDEGKLYWDRDKLVSYCFRCETVGILKSDKPISEVMLELALTRLRDKLSIQVPDKIKLTSLPYEKMFDTLDEEGRSYIESRCPLYSDIIDKLQFRSSPKYGVSLPVIIDDITVAYIIRVFPEHVKDKRKYLLATGVKYLYSPNNIINSRTRYCEVTLVEGTFDAIGALLDGYPNPIACFGKTITPLQIHVLRKLCPTKINIYLDETSLSFKLMHKIRRSFPTCSDIQIINSNYDPEEKLNFKIKRAKTDEDFKGILSNYNYIVKLLKG